MSAFWVFPLYVLVWTADTAAAAFMAAFIPYLHPSTFPLVNLSGAKDRTNFIWAFCHTNVIIENGQMGFRITFKPQEILFFLNIFC